METLVSCNEVTSFNGFDRSVVTATPVESLLDGLGLPIETVGLFAVVLAFVGGS